MASKPSAGANPRPSSGPPQVVVHRNSYGGGDRSFMVLMVALVVSAVAHFLVLPIFLLFNFGKAEEVQTQEASVIETKVTEDPKPADLENDEVGIDPEVPQTNYNVDRIEPVSIPGVVDKEAPIGIPGGTDATPMNVPPPPGFGGSTGTGGGVDSPTPGLASTIGLPGGMGGPLMKPGGIGGRSAATRQKMVTEGGGNGPSEAAVAAGLKWLHFHQAQDGHWSVNNFNSNARVQLANGEFRYERCNCQGNGGTDNDIAGTAFGLLPMLGAGQTHRGTGEKGSIYTKDVERALKFLIVKQNAQGDFGGGMYSHGLATITMCEAYGLTSDPMLKGPAQRAVNFIAKGQSGAGGWSYTAPCTGHDTSVGGWQLMALKSGQMSGLDVPTKTLSGASRWLDDVASADGSTYGYQSPGATPTMTAVGLLCRMYLGWGPRNPGLQKGIAFLKKTPPKAMKNMYYYYYSTQVMHHIGGESWEYWNPLMRDWLVQTQDRGDDPKHAHQKGSWDPAGDAWGAQGGRLMVTALSILTLEVYYRHLPLYRREMGGGKAA